MMNSVYLTQTQKMEYNITWVENFRLKLQAQKQDLQNQVLSYRARLQNIKFDEDWAELWKAWKPKRSLNHMLDSLIFYDEADKFLKSKSTEMKMVLKFSKNPEAIDPIEIAQHQVRHQHLLEKLERESGPDCEEMLANMEQGMMMFEANDEFEVSIHSLLQTNKIKSFYSNRMLLSMIYILIYFLYQYIKFIYIFSFNWVVML